MGHNPVTKLSLYRLALRKAEHRESPRWDVVGWVCHRRACLPRAPLLPWLCWVVFWNMKCSNLSRVKPAVLSFKTSQSHFFFTGRQRSCSDWAVIILITIKFFFVVFVVVVVVCLFLLHCTVCGILVPRPGIEPGPSAVRAQSPNHWTARKFPLLCVIIIINPICLCHSRIQPPAPCVVQLCGSSPARRSYS